MTRLLRAGPRTADGPEGARRWPRVQREEVNGMDLKDKLDELAANDAEHGRDGKNNPNNKPNGK